ncbi:MAG: DNA polymerase III subunit gamma/tau [Patescibacteria group bacterium]
MPALYRTYRPQTFRDVACQPHITETLRNEVAHDQCAQSFVFSGPRGVGKTSTARVLAKAVNCTGRKKNDGEPCNVCDACREISAGKSLDIIEIDAASHTGVDTVREVIIETARFSPSRLKVKAFIIDEAHMLSDAAWNALLKILEEPPAHVMFIFATTEFHKVPATILSRCQRFDFRRLSSAEITERLKFITGEEKRKVEEAVLLQIARLADGSFRDAESLLEQVLTLGGEEITEEQATLVLPKSSFGAAIDFLETLFRADAKAGIELVNAHAYDGFDLEYFTRDAVELFRKVILLKSQASGKGVLDFSLGKEYETRLGEMARNVPFDKLVLAIGVFIRAGQELKTTPIPQLPLELAVLEICGDSAPAVSAPQMPLAINRAPKTETPPLAQKPNTSGLQPAESPSVVEASVEAKADEPAGAPEAVALPMLSASLEVVRAKWNGFVQAVMAENNSLPFLLKLAEPIGVENGTLRIGVGYVFHRDKLNEIKNRTLLEKILERELNGRIRIEAILQEQKSGQDGAFDDVLKAFGGRIVG